MYMLAEVVLYWRYQEWVLKKSVPFRAFGGLNPAFDLVGTALTGPMQWQVLVVSLAG